MNTKKLLIGLSLGLSLLTTSILADDAKARAIMEKADARPDGKTLQQDMKMVLIDRRGQKRVRSMKSFSKKFGKDKYTIMFFKSPSDVKNTAFLTYDYASGSKDDDQWLYIPALKKTKRIPSGDKSSNFMGSDFSYFDMTKINLDAYNFKMLKKAKVRGKKGSWISLTPRSKKTIKESGYIKQKVFVQANNYVVIRSVGTMRGGKTKYLDIPKMHKQSGVWIMDEMKMTLKKGKKTLHKTLLRFSKTKLNKSLKDSMFKTRRLTKGL